LWHDTSTMSFILALLTTLGIAFSSPAPVEAVQVIESNKVEPKLITETVPNVPFYSQFEDITSPSWKKVGCGIASLAMIIDYYMPAIDVDTLLKEGIARGAYLQNAGWTYSGLISVAKNHGLNGTTYDFGNLDSKIAFIKLSSSLEDGPVVVSIHYKFEPTNPIPHLVVINGIKDGFLYYNDPAAKTGELKISSSDFLKAWKKRYIVFRPI